MAVVRRFHVLTHTPRWDIPAESRTRMARHPVRLISISTSIVRAAVLRHQAMCSRDVIERRLISPEEVAQVHFPTYQVLG